MVGRFAVTCWDPDCGPKQLLDALSRMRTDTPTNQNTDKEDTNTEKEEEQEATIETPRKQIGKVEDLRTENERTEKQSHCQVDGDAMVLLFVALCRR